MTNEKKKEVKQDMMTMLDVAIASDYLPKVVDAIFDDVVEDIDCAADVDFNNDDVRLAIGRAFMDKLGLYY